MRTRPRVLLSSYQCGPGMGSVSQIGWNWYRLLSERLPVSLVTHIRNRGALTSAGAPLPGSEVVYIDTEWLAKPLYTVTRLLFRSSEHAVFLFSSFDYFVYDRAAWRMLKRGGQCAGEWNIIHIPTPVSPWAATLLHRLGPPVILGPWNGGLASPANFPEIMRADAAWTYPIRNLGRLVNTWRKSTHNAARILVANRSTRAAIPVRDQDRCLTMLENAVDTEVFQPVPYPHPPSTTSPLKVVFIGRLVPFKGVSMLLEAVERFRGHCPIEATVVGEGPLEASLHREAASRNIQTSVRFVGKKDQKGVVEEIGRAHLFCLPSVRESGGAVVLEAMACARPVVAVAYGGPAELVDESVGRALPPNGREAVVQGLLATFSDLLESPKKWEARGLNGRQRVLERHTWRAKIDAVLDIYGEMLP